MKNFTQKLLGLTALVALSAQATPPFSDPPLATAPVSILETMSPGVYFGTGTWKDELGHTGSFTDQTEITPYAGRAGVLISTTLSWRTSAGFAQDKKMSYTAVDQAQNGFFKITAADPSRTVGEGYCYAYQCSLKAGDAMTNIEETLTFSNNRLYKIGSKMESGKKIVWQSELPRR